MCIHLSGRAPVLLLLFISVSQPDILIYSSQDLSSKNSKALRAGLMLPLFNFIVLLFCSSAQLINDAGIEKHPARTRSFFSNAQPYCRIYSLFATLTIT